MRGTFSPLTYMRRGVMPRH